MKYSFNIIKGRENMAFAQGYDIDASYKDLAAVCDAIRYMKAAKALGIASAIEEKKRAVLYRRHSKHMGARHELHGRKGAYPVKAAGDVRRVLVNAMANARNNGMDAEEMVVIHASSNKTHIERRQPSKGTIAWGRGMYGRSALMHSDLEYAKVEIVLAEEWHSGITAGMKRLIERRNPAEKKQTTQKPAPKKSNTEAKARVPEAKAQV